ncbi:hypothetical protein ABID21_003671 [Pseudorhizobium tarimense]|uniref:Uncharacterized protein n=1 Tax=Pseudorhizobium tarimense TaxID=1079109 RepID=A0ABV2HAH8_9HYPH
MKVRKQEPRERAARAMCRLEGFPAQKLDHYLKAFEAETSKRPSTSSSWGELVLARPHPR